MSASSQRIKLVRELSNNLGLLSKDSSTNLIKPLKLAYEPYICPSSIKQTMQQAHLLWQKMVVMASKDHVLINRLFGGQLKDQDEMIRNLLEIYNQVINKDLQCRTFDFCRTDFFVDSQINEPKLIQYNFQATSMFSHSQKYHYVQQLVSLQQTVDSEQRSCKAIAFQRLNKNQPLQLFANTLSDYYNMSQFKGIVLIVIQSAETNVFDINSVVLQLIKRGIRVKKDTFEGINADSEISQNNHLYYKGQQVSIIYYRTGYRPQDFISKKGGNQCWQAVKKIELSQAVKIPNVKTMLANQKRMQVQLSKKHVYSQYLDQRQCQILEKTLVRNFDFDDQSQHENIFLEIEKKGFENFIAKPNKQGGGNNIFGKEAYQFLKSLSPKARKNYIVMQMIYPESHFNIFIGNDQFSKLQTVSQISQYGLIVSECQKFVKNVAEGYLVRTKPILQKEGGIMAGVSAIGYMKVV